jgi:hypothetical protein
VRTTLTLDDDVAAKLQAEVRKTGASFKETVNRVLRRGLSAPKPRLAPYKVKAKNMGVRPGLNYDNIQELLDQLDGPARR